MTRPLRPCPGDSPRDTAKRDLARRPERGELVRHFEVLRGEAEQRRRTSSGSARCASAVDALERTPAQQHALKIRRRHVVAERRDVHLRSSEIVNTSGARAKPRFVYESLARSLACAAATNSRSSGGVRAAHRMPVARKLRLRAREPDIRGGERPVAENARLQSRRWTRAPTSIARRAPRERLAGHALDSPREQPSSRPACTFIATARTRAK